MIQFINPSSEEPYLIFKSKYDLALIEGQKNIEALSISTYNKVNKEVDSRYVNLKYIDDKKFIFFSNYESPKAKAFNYQDQIAALFYWPSINTQIRIKAKIAKTSKSYNQAYFEKRSPDKNALAICSKQSAPITSFDKIIENHQKAMKYSDLTKCPDYWGGFSFTPFYFEFWHGNESRINKREVFELRDDQWIHFCIQP
jgi:pyridoxamine 5'-phosphate oxidase